MGTSAVSVSISQTNVVTARQNSNQTIPVSASPSQALQGTRPVSTDRWQLSNQLPTNQNEAANPAATANLRNFVSSPLYENSVVLTLLGRMATAGTGEPEAAPSLELFLERMANAGIDPASVQIGEVVNVGSLAFRTVVVPGKMATIVFQGTGNVWEPGATESMRTWTDPRGPGFSEYEAARSQIAQTVNSLRQTGLPVSFSGFSLGGAEALYAAADFGQAGDQVYALHTPGVSQAVTDSIVSKQISSLIFLSETDPVRQYGESLPAGSENNRLFMFRYQQATVSENTGFRGHTFNAPTSISVTGPDALTGLRLGVDRQRAEPTDIVELGSIRDSGPRQVITPIKRQIFDLGLGLIDLMRNIGVRPYIRTTPANPLDPNSPNQSVLGVQVPF